MKPSDKNRVSDRAVADFCQEGYGWAPETIKLALDLRDARKRIKELERLSASQEEALGMMERGSL